MKHKVSELSGELLNAAVAQALELPLIRSQTGGWLARSANGAWYPWRPATEWRDAGPLIERERISVCNPNGDPGWAATIAYPVKPKRNGTPQWRHHMAFGRTPLVAALRAFLVSKVGEEVELPE